MGQVCPVATNKLIIMHLRELIYELFARKNPPVNNGVKNQLDRIPIETPGLVQLNFIHNLI